MESNSYYKQLLWSAAIATATQSGYYFGRDCEEETKKVIDTGVEKMFRDGPINDMVRLEEARINTMQLTLAMIEEVAKNNTLNNTPNDALKRLSESSLASALAKLCPCFPFC